MHPPGPVYDKDPQAPFVVQDGLEYEDLAAFLVNDPIDSWRNTEILSRRARKEPEEFIRRWIHAYDGADYVAGSCSTRARQLQAWNDTCEYSF